MRAMRRRLLCALAATSALVDAELLNNTEWGRRYLERNKFEKGVIETASGLQYKVIEVGAGKTHPTQDSDCVVHYQGQTAFMYEPGKRRWQTFDSSAFRACAHDINFCRENSHSFSPPPCRLQARRAQRVQARRRHRGLARGAADDGRGRQVGAHRPAAFGVRG